MWASVFFGDQTAWTNDDQCLQLHYGRPQIMFAIQPSDAYYCVQLFDSIGFELYAKDRLMTSIEFHLVPASYFLHRQLDGVPMLWRLHLFGMHFEPWWLFEDDHVTVRQYVQSLWPPACSTASLSVERCHNLQRAWPRPNRQYWSICHLSAGLARGQRTSWPWNLLQPFWKIR